MWFSPHEKNGDELQSPAWMIARPVETQRSGFIGIFGARLGFPVLDPIAFLVICGFILKVLIDVFRDAVGKMTDKPADAKTEAKMQQVIMSQDSMVGIDNLKTRLFGNLIYVDVDISDDGTKVLSEAHEVASQVHDAIESEFERVKHCTVHVSPSGLVEEDD
ncbi:MAG: hypothetical protein FWH40_10120 [Coriobacteriia bacterium]|nr:hypothetical protein [Coriobacteriia bacterium]